MLPALPPPGLYDVPQIPSQAYWETMVVPSVELMEKALQPLMGLTADDVQSVTGDEDLDRVMCLPVPMLRWKPPTKHTRRSRKAASNSYNALARRLV
jgi:hypothetical protein